MQYLLYSEYIEKNGLIVMREDGRAKMEIFSGCTLALDQKGELVRYTHSKNADVISQDEVSLEALVDKTLTSLQQPNAEIVARVPYPVTIAEINSNGKLVIIDEKLWLKHCGDLPNCYQVKGKNSEVDFSPGY